MGINDHTTNELISYYNSFLLKKQDNHKEKYKEFQGWFSASTAGSCFRKQYFNVNQYTDVIAFDISDNKDCLEAEIYISIDDVRANSKMFKQTFNEEINTDIYNSGLLNNYNYHLNPLKLLLGLANELVKLRVKIYENWFPTPSSSSCIKIWWYRAHYLLAYERAS